MRLTRLSRPLIKLFGNISKVSSYVFHAAFPKLRFEIPSHSNPIIRRQSKPESRLIPTIIWQTNFTNRVTLPVYINYLFNRIMSPTFAYRFMTTAERDTFVSSSYPGAIYSAYRRLQIGAAQADYWRLLVLLKHGGVYMDIDAHLIWPLGWIIKGNDSEVLLRTKAGEISNYFIASMPSNPILEDIARQVMINIETESSDNVYDITGPGVYNSVLRGRTVHTGYYQDICNQGNFTNEYFQYIDKPQGKWTKEQVKLSVVRKRSDL
jgi:mannosyltransferase OCH1-like enzyme